MLQPDHNWATVLPVPALHYLGLVLVLHLNPRFHHTWAENQHEVEICYFTLPQNVAEYVHPGREPKLMYTIQVFYVCIKTT